MTIADQGSATSRAVDWQCDKVYNRTLWTDTLGGVNVGYQDNALHQYTQIGAATPSYDTKGNLTCVGQWWSMSYDCENRLVSAIDGTMPTRPNTSTA